jgi:hypothetical protein
MEAIKRYQDAEFKEVKRIGEIKKIVIGLAANEESIVELKTCQKKLDTCNWREKKWKT